MSTNAGIIFDLDGVLVNTSAAHFAAYKKLFEARGVAYSHEDFIKKTDGIGRDQGIRNILGDLPEEEIKRLGLQKQQYYIEKLKENPPELMPGVLELLALLERVTWKKAVASSSKNGVLLLNLVRIADRFDAITTGHDFTHPKPNPEIYLLAAGRIGMTPARCVAIEDSVAGVTAANAAGMATIGLEHFGRQLEHATVRIRSLAEVTLPLLEMLLQQKKFSEGGSR